jgi:hypothetical protein
MQGVVIIYILIFCKNVYEILLLLTICIDVLQV